jgi:peptidylprolyl isomerase
MLNRKKRVFSAGTFGYYVLQQSAIMPQHTLKGITMAKAELGNKVRIDYTGTLEDGTVFDSTLDDICSHDECESDDCSDDDCGCEGHESGPMELTIGEHDLFPHVDEALIGMTPGEKKTVIIPAADAFGEHDKDKVFTVPRSDMPEDLNPEIGDELVLTNEDDEELGVIVVATTAGDVTFDSNHPLAGEDLTFEITLLEIL